MIDHIDQEPNAVVSPLEVERREASVIREERGEVRGSGSGEVKKRANDKGCPPKKGWATVWMEGYVWSMFVVPVSSLFPYLLYRPPTTPKSFCAQS